MYSLFDNISCSWSNTKIAGRVQLLFQFLTASMYNVDIKLWIPLLAPLSHFWHQCPASYTIISYFWHQYPTSDTNIPLLTPFCACLQLKYHEDFETNIKGKKLQVTDDPETLRHKQLSSIISQVEYQGHHSKQADMEARRNLVDTGAHHTPSVGWSLRVFMVYWFNFSLFCSERISACIQCRDDLSNK